MSKQEEAHACEQHDPEAHMSRQQDSGDGAEERREKIGKEPQRGSQHCGVCEIVG